MKYILHFTLARETFHHLSERLTTIRLPDYLRETCDIGLHEADLMISDWACKDNPPSGDEEFFILDQVMRRLGFVDDMTRNMPLLEVVPS